MKNGLIDSDNVLNRRAFLKASGIAAVGVALDPAAESKQASDLRSADTEAGKSSPGQSLVHHVQVLQGTESTRVFSRGNTLPIAAMPFGMAHWTIESRSGSPGMFHPGDRRIQGFRSTHQSSPWLGDYGYATFLPSCGNGKLDAASRASSYRPEDARLSPHSFRMKLLRYGIDVELIPTERCAMVTANFSKEDAPGWVVEIPGDQSPTWEHDEVHRTVTFASRETQGGVPEGFATYYVLRFTEAWESVELKQQKGKQHWCREVCERN